MTLPAARPGTRILYISEEQYYRIREEPAWKSYPVYAPDREPPGYLDRLRTLKPETVFDPTKLNSPDEWIHAGQEMFDTPFEFTQVEASPVRDPQWWKTLRPPVAADGSIPGRRYVIRKKGQVEVGGGACAVCHSRVMPDGGVIRGAQGNFPFEAAYAYEIRRAGQPRRKLSENERRHAPAFVFPGMPEEERSYGLYKMSAGEIAEAYEAMIPGLATRAGFSIFDPPKIADLIGLKDRNYLDMTARFEHRGIGDIMRYAATCAGANYFFSSLATLPPEAIPPLAESWRPSDAVYYAIALYVYSLKPPPNPNKPRTEADEALAAHGAKIFRSEGCANCHRPPLYTNNKLTPAGNFAIPEWHWARYDILEKRVGTDERSATVSDRGRGYYKVPSLLGVWYRGPFEHKGSVATLEDWFDERRLGNNYVPTGFRGYRVTHRAVKGHEYGLDLSADEKRALISFLKTL